MRNEPIRRELMKRLTKEEARPHNTPDTNDTNSVEGNIGTIRPASTVASLAEVTERRNPDDG
jgi:hypothetical protein